MLEKSGAGGGAADGIGGALALVLLGFPGVVLLD